MSSSSLSLSKIVLGLEHPPVTSQTQNNPSVFVGLCMFGVFVCMSVCVCLRLSVRGGCMGERERLDRSVTRRFDTYFFSSIIQSAVYVTGYFPLFNILYTQIHVPFQVEFSLHYLRCLCRVT